MTENPALSDQRLEHVDHEVVRHGRVGSLAAAAVLRGVEPAAVVKTMVVRKGEGDYLFVLVPGDRVIDWPKLRSHVGERRLSMPDAEEALAATGYARGTITPFGAKHPWPVLADAELGAASRVSIGGGDHGVSISVDASELIAALDASVVDVTKPED